MGKLLLAAGHFWLFGAVVLFVGRSVARTQPVMYSFFGIGAWLPPATYNSLVGAAAVIGISSIIAAFITCDRSNVSHHSA